MAQAKNIDVGILSPSDFCIMGKHMEFKNYDVEEMEKEIREHLKEFYDINDIVYINPIFDISNFYQIFAKYNKLMKLKNLAENHRREYCQTNNCSFTDYIKILKTACPKDAPMQSIGLLRATICDPDEITKQIDEL